MKLGVIASKGSSAYTELERLARSSGHEVETIAVDAAGAASHIEKLIETADALILASPIVFADAKPEWQRRIHLRIASDSVRLLLIASPQEIGLQNQFLFFYGIQVEDRPIRGDSPITVRRSPHAFRDPSLFAGVENIELCEPMVLEIRAETLPVLVLSGVSIHENESGKPVVAVWHALGGGALIVAGATLVADRRRLAGGECAGIGVNDRFAQNLLQFLLPATARAAVPAPPVVPKEPSADELMSRTERNLADLLVTVLEIDSDLGWYECVPEKIRLEAIRVHEQERGQLPKHAYLFLIQFREIIQANFSKFDALLKSVGWSGGKEASTVWLVKLNEHRKMSAHPVRAHVSGHVFSDEVIEFLTDVDARVSAMLKKAGDDQH